ncbi:MAG: MlaD family protein [Chthoniobacterales bacterium]|jgi:ABC-type transporter Mla subunit MlaD
MSANTRYFKIGLFVLAGLALLVAGLLFLGADSMFRPRLYLETYVDGTVQGIDVGSPVKFRGVQIGRVSRVDFCFNEYGPQPGEGRLDYVYIEMEVNKQVFRGMFNAEVDAMIQQAVDQGLRVMLQPQGITGLNFAELNYVDASSRPPPLKIWWTPRHPYIPSAPGTLASMLDSVNSIMDTFNALDIKDTMKDVNDALQGFNDTLKQLSGGMDDLQLAKISGDIQGVLADLKTKIDQLPVKQLGDDGSKAMQSLAAASGELKDLADAAQTSPLLNADAVGAIVSDVKAAAENLRVLTENLREYPSQLLLGEPPKRSPFDPAGQKTKPRR